MINTKHRFLTALIIFCATPFFNIHAAAPKETPMCELTSLPELLNRVRQIQWTELENDAQLAQRYWGETVLAEQKSLALYQKQRASIDAMISSWGTPLPLTYSQLMGLRNFVGTVWEITMNNQKASPSHELIARLQRDQYYAHLKPLPKAPRTPTPPPSALQEEEDSFFAYLDTNRGDEERKRHVDDEAASSSDDEEEERKLTTKKPSVLPVQHLTQMGTEEIGTLISTLAEMNELYRDDEDALALAYWGGAPDRCDSARASNLSSNDSTMDNCWNQRYAQQWDAASQVLSRLKEYEKTKAPRWDAILSDNLCNLVRSPITYLSVAGAAYKASNSSRAPRAARLILKAFAGVATACSLQRTYMTVHEVKNPHSSWLAKAERARRNNILRHGQQ